MKPISRRVFLKSTAWGLGGLLTWNTSLGQNASPDKKTARPNIILCMCDDLGWGDVGFHDHPHIKTPHLDEMAGHSLRLDRFYAGSAVCSPTRGSALTGRNPQRYGIFFANVGKMKKEEVTLAEVLKVRGYVTGHFGKWHLGSLTTKIKDSNRGKPGNSDDYSPPWENGFDTCFSTEAKVPTWNPMYEEDTMEFYGTRYWTGPESPVPWESPELRGDDSRVIMDHALPFIKNAASQENPFFAVIWFHTPHSPTIAGPEYKALYADCDDNQQHYFGCITAMDEQIGRLRQALRAAGIADQTMLWFCSDNGPAGKGGGTAQQPGERQQGISGPFRGRKGSLYEGGVRVPGLLEWPKVIKKGVINSDYPCSTCDYFPTTMDVLGVQADGQTKPIDGVSLLPLIMGESTQRPSPIGFELRKAVSLTDNRYKIVSFDAGKTFELYDLINDPGESSNIADKKPEMVTAMKATLSAWRDSCVASYKGDDY